MSRRIAIVEDDKTLRENYSDVLRHDRRGQDDGLPSIVCSSLPEQQSG